MLQRNHSVAPGYWQSRWAKSHGEAQDKDWPRCFCKTAAPEKQALQCSAGPVLHTASGRTQEVGWPVTQLRVTPHSLKYSPHIRSLMSACCLVRREHRLLPAALPIWTSCFEYSRFLLLVQLRETATALRRPQATRVHPATELALLLPCWELGTIEGSHEHLPLSSFSPPRMLRQESLRHRL